MPGDSFVSQLLSITYEIYKSFDFNPSVDITGVFLIILKVIERIRARTNIFENSFFPIALRNG